MLSPVAKTGLVFDEIVMMIESTVGEMLNGDDVINEALNGKKDGDPEDEPPSHEAP